MDCLANYFELRLRLPVSESRGQTGIFESAMGAENLLGTYAIRTCNFCGLRRPQPSMAQVKIYVEIGVTKQSISGATLFGAFIAGDKKAANAVRSSVFETNSRKHFRSKTVWICGDSKCRAQAKALEKKSRNGVSQGFAVVAVVFLGVIGLGSANNDAGRKVAHMPSPRNSGPPAAPGQIETRETSLGRMPDQSLTQSSVSQKTVKLSLIEVKSYFLNQSGWFRRGIQQRFRLVGIYTGKIDGVWGKMTESAFLEALAKEDSSEFMAQPTETKCFVFFNFILSPRFLDTFRE